MSDIFISYSQSDRDKARMLADALQSEGWSVWWDRKIPPGKTFDEVIEQAIESAKCVVVLWSKESVKSGWVKAEAAEGKSRGILIPATIDDGVKIPLEFRYLHASRLTDWQGQHDHAEFGELRVAVAAKLGGVTKPPSDDTEAKRTVDSAGAMAAKDRVDQEIKETKVGRKTPSVYIPGFQNRLWLLALVSTILVVSVGFIWLRSRLTPEGSQVTGVVLPTPPGSNTARSEQTSNPTPNAPPQNGPVNDKKTASDSQQQPTLSEAGDKPSSPQIQPRTPLPATNQPPATSDRIVVDGRLTWTRTDNGKDIDWNGANQYCKEMTLDGLSGWRLPKFDELAKLYDPKRGNDREIRKPFRLTSYWMWSSTEGSAFNFLTGDDGRSAYPLVGDNLYRALCVRGSGE